MIYDCTASERMAGTKIDVAFIGSCTNGRLSDLREAAQVAAGHRVASHVRALVVPGSQKVAIEAEREFHLAQINLGAAILGGGAAATTSQTASAAPAEGGGGH